jgi:hypothetical protein
LTEWHSDPPPVGTEHQDIEMARISQEEMERHQSSGSD